MLAGKHTLNEDLYVVTAIFNPRRFQSRYRLYADFAKMVTDAGGILYTIELAFGDRPFYCTEAENPRHVQLRTWYELWHKERLLNLLIHRLPPSAQKIAWIDADVVFTRPDWVKETVELLEHFYFLQMFSHSRNLGPDYEPIGPEVTSFAYEFYQADKDHSRFVNKLQAKGGPCYYTYYGGYGEPLGHPGYAWAARREALDHVGGLIDFGILGANDRHIGFGLIGQIEQSLDPRIRGGYRRQCLSWQDRANRYIARDIGMMPGMVYHHWHGKLKDRRYHDRWKILIDTHYDPDIDIKDDSQGVFQLTERSPALRDGLRAYFRARNEDSIDAE
jgi:hypothetical protein